MIKRRDSQLITFALFAALFFIFIAFIPAFASAYLPPQYIANPATKECMYYFAGEQDCFDSCMNDCQGAGLNYTNCADQCGNKYCHYNQKPAGFTVDIGATTDFKDVNESCKVWRGCFDSGGIWNGTILKCLPNPASQKQKSSDFLAIAGITISMIALVAIIIIYLKIRKMLRHIHAEKR